MTTKFKDKIFVKVDQEVMMIFLFCLFVEKTDDFIIKLCEKNATISIKTWSTFALKKEIWQFPAILKFKLKRKMQMRICQDINHKKGRIVRGKNELFFIIKVKQFFGGGGGRNYKSNKKWWRWRWCDWLLAKTYLGKWINYLLRQRLRYFRVDAKRYAKFSY